MFQFSRIKSLLSFLSCSGHLEVSCAPIICLSVFQCLADSSSHPIWSYLALHWLWHVIYFQGFAGTWMCPPLCWDGRFRQTSSKSMCHPTLALLPLCSLLKTSSSQIVVASIITDKGYVDPAGRGVMGIFLVEAHDSPHKWPVSGSMGTLCPRVQCPLGLCQQ